VAGGRVGFEFLAPQLARPLPAASLQLAKLFHQDVA